VCVVFYAHCCFQVGESVYQKDVSLENTKRGSITFEVLLTELATATETGDTKNHAKIKAVNDHIYDSDSDVDTRSDLSIDCIRDGRSEVDAVIGRNGRFDIQSETIAHSHLHTSLKHRKGVLKISSITCTSIRGSKSFSLMPVKVFVEVRVENQVLKTAVQKMSHAKKLPGAKSSSVSGFSPGKSTTSVAFPEEFHFNVNSISNCIMICTVKEFSSLSNAHKALHIPVTIDLRTVVNHGPGPFMFSSPLETARKDKKDDRLSATSDHGGLPLSPAYTGDSRNQLFECELQWMPTLRNA
jgi:hypothetical protein